MTSVISSAFDLPYFPGIAASERRHLVRTGT
jgi:hypothetical protein